MKRKTLIISLALVATLAISGSVAASSNLNSKGTINIDADATTNGYEVIIDSNDLAVLDSRIDELDTLVAEGKSTLADAINGYPNQNVTTLDTFANLATAIDTINEIPDIYYYDKSTEGDNCSRYILIDGSYYPCDKYGIKTSDTALSGTITIVSKNDTTAPITGEIQLVKYKSTTDGNLSAGSAGYADKAFILGSGSDNITYQNQSNKSLVQVSLPYTATEDTVGIGIVCAAWRLNTPDYQNLSCYLQKNGSTILSANSSSSGNLTASVGFNSSILTIKKGDVFSFTKTTSSTSGSPTIINANAYLYILK